MTRRPIALAGSTTRLPSGSASMSFLSGQNDAVPKMK
jgi:hypothetical protein